MSSRSSHRWCGVAQEAVLVFLLMASPWAYGAGEPIFRAIVLAGVSLLVALAAVRWFTATTFDWRDGPVVLTLAGLFLVTAIQYVPLPTAVLEFVSPRTLEYRRDLLPTEPEVFSGEGVALVPLPNGWQPISLYPEATRKLLVDLLALFLLAVIVRQQLLSWSAFRRLSWAALINGSALALFGLAQSLSSPSNLIYWSIETDGSGFGPFVCRNHFPYYMSLCIGLSAGLMFSRRSASMLNDPTRLWIAGGVGLMAVASLFSLSRGGAVAMAGSTAFIAVLAWRLRARASAGGLALAFGVGVALLIAGWLGTMPLESRLESMTQASNLERDRLSIWRSFMSHLARFPVFGSGGGTFALFDHQYQTTPRSGPMFMNEHAHNEYLEALVEGGVMRLALTLCLAAAPVWLVWRQLRSRPWDGTHGSILAALWGLVAVAIHSVVDFGLHLPANAMFAVVIAVYVTTLAKPKSASVPTATFPPSFIAAIALPLAGFLAWEAGTLALADRYELNAYQLSKSPNAEVRAEQFPRWEAAIRLRPGDAILRQSVGQAYLDEYLRTPTESNVAQLLRLAAVHLIECRNRCPLLAHPHARLAEMRPHFAKADSSVQYLNRARMLLPGEPDVWHALGRAYCDAGDRDEAVRIWRRYLEMSDRRLPEILNRSRRFLSPDAVRASLLAPRAEQWIAAAEQLFPNAEQVADRKPFLEHALDLWNAEPRLANEILLRKIDVEKQLKRYAEAEASYRELLRREPNRDNWRLELARMLHQSQKLNEAQAELQILISRDRNNKPARDLSAIVKRELELRE